MCRKTTSVQTGSSKARQQGLLVVFFSLHADFVSFFQKGIQWKE